MVLFSKLETSPYSCTDYNHPWTRSCSDAAGGIFVDAVQDSFRIYVTVYMLALLMRGKIPTKRHIKKTLLGITQSTAFLTTNAYAFMLSMCAVRKVLGSFNYFTVSFIPAFIASYLAILIERPSRRSMLALYVTNIASETLFRMAARRGLVRPIPHGEVYIFMMSVSTLLYFFRAQRQNANDSVISLLRFVVGPYEEQGYTENREDLPSPRAQRREVKSLHPWLVLTSIRHMISRYFRPVAQMIKQGVSHPTCPHPFSCLHYTLQGGLKLFSVGYGLQACMTLLLRMKKLIRKPSLVPSLLLSKESCELGMFLGGFSAIFRLTSCFLRHVRNKDSKLHAVPAGLLAGTTFHFYPSTTVALYMMWKTLQVMYNAGTEEGYLPELPWATILLYCFSTAVLFHAGVLEPSSLRPSYWKFLISISGGRVVEMSRAAISSFGPGGSKFNLI